MIKVAAAQYPISFFSQIDEWINKTTEWVEIAVKNGSQYLLFPEYGSMELTSLLTETQRNNLTTQAKELKSFLPEFIETFRQLSVKHQCYIIAPSFPVYHDENKTTNRVFIFAPSGVYDYQDKLFMTRFEDEQWKINEGEAKVKIFETEKLKFMIVTCFDVEFPYASMLGAQLGVEVVFVPSCTETVKGLNRVHIGARARALENQSYVVVSQTVGQALWSPAVDVNNGYAAVYSTPDLGFSEDGVVAQEILNKECWLYCELNLQKLNDVKNEGAVFNYKKNQRFVNQLMSFYQVGRVKL